jgi:asparagine synthase (glutamine-hydrolysing)
MGRICTDIILTGDGPDQTLAGSAHHLHAQQSDLFVYRNRMTRAFYKWGAFLAERIQRNPAPSFLSKMRRNFYRKSLDPVQMIYELRSYCPNIVKQHLCGKGLWQTHLKNNPYRHPERWFNEAKGLDNVNKYLFADIKFYVPDDLMIKVDRMCMAHGLETLSPFQDVQLGRYIQQMPGSYKLNTAPDGTITTKYILKKVCEKRFPASTLQKKKQGFGIPLKKWLKQNNADYLKSVLLDSRTLNRGYFEKSALKSMVYDFVAGRDDYFYASHFSMFALITLELWHRQYID